MSANSLYAEHPGRFDVPAIILVSLVGLLFGLTMPVVTMSSVLAEDSTYSVIGGMLDFWQSGDRLVGVLVLMFSVLFPFGKLGALLWLWFLPTRRELRQRHLRIIDPLGKWSMLDVLVVILLAGSVKLGFIADAEVRGGAYVFGGAVVLSMIAASLMNALAGPDESYARYPRRRSLLLPLIASGSLVLLVGGLLVPLMSVEKWLLWSEEYSIVLGAVELWMEGQSAMAVAFALFVIVLPLALQLAQVALAFIQLTGKSGGRAVVWLMEINRWAMTDVFALALFVAFIKLGSWANVSPQPGLYLFLAAIVLSVFISLWLRWLYGRHGVDERRVSKA